MKLKYGEEDFRLHKIEVFVYFFLERECRGVVVDIKKIS